MEEWNVPILRHFLLFRAGYPYGEASREMVMRVVFGLQPSIPYPFLLPPLKAFVQLSDALGTFEFAIEVYRSGSNTPIAFAEEMDFTFDNRLSVFSFTRGVENIPIAEPGLYEFRLFTRLLRDHKGTPQHDTVRQWLATETLMLEEFEL